LRLSKCTAVSTRQAGTEYTPDNRAPTQPAGKHLKANEGGVTFSGGERVAAAFVAAIDRLDDLHVCSTPPAGAVPRIWPAAGTGGLGLL
jgi:hypothetical protein